jgi:Ca-activated chloride channel family protein
VSFAAPGRLAIVVVPIALCLVYLIVQRGRRKYVERFASDDLFGSVAPRRPSWERHIAAVLWLFAVLALVLGFARPSMTQKKPKHGGTVVVAIDTSSSMALTDVAPTRIGAATAAARSFVNGLPSGVKVGLVSFDATARLLVAPIADHAPVVAALDGLHLRGGTATADAIMQSLKAISSVPPGADGKKVPATIVLMSDGLPSASLNGLSPLAAVDVATAAAKQAGVPIDTIAFGALRGTANNTAAPYDPQEMAKIAADTGGKAFTAASGRELNSVYAEISRRVGYDTVRHDMTEWFVALGLLCGLLAGAAGLTLMQRIP